MRTMLAFAVSAALLLQSCYPVGVRKDLPLSSLEEGEHVDVPTKIHLKNGSVVLCEKGFTVQNGKVRADGTLYALHREKGSVQSIVLEASEILGIEYYDKVVTPGRAIASLLYGSVEAAMVVAGVALLAVAVFGSCPTVYVEEEGDERLVGESFSFSVGKLFEMSDLDLVGPWSSDSVSIHVKNEALETHYIDRLWVSYADHPKEGTVFPTDDGRAILVGRLTQSTRAENSEGTDVRTALRAADEDPYALDSSAVERLSKQGVEDWVDVEFPVSAEAKKVALVLRVRNTLLTTTLLYETMMREQGASAMRWLEDINQDMWYAMRLGKWYKKYSGIRIAETTGGGNIERGKAFNCGPIAWRDVVVPIDIEPGREILRLRLSFVLDNWFIDRVSLADSYKELELQDAVLAEGSFDAPDGEEIKTDDGSYLVTYPGFSTRMTFHLPQRVTTGRTLFVSSDGYYTEWMRPEWLMHRAGKEDAFDVSEGVAPIQRAMKTWIARKNTFEKQFFASRIPVAKGAKVR